MAANYGPPAGPPSRKRRYYNYEEEEEGNGHGSILNQQQGPPAAVSSAGMYRDYEGPPAYHSPYSQMARPQPPLLPSPIDLPGPGSEATTNLIVNYLPQTLADEELHEMFAPYGEISNLRIVRDKNTGYSFGYGFVRYVYASSAAMAVSVLNGLQVLNKVIKVSYARPPSEDIKDTNLYITNLPRTTTDEDLERMFLPFGEIVQKHILYDKYTQLPRGVAFVRYDRREQANAAIEAMNGFTPPGTEEALQVRLAENHGKQKAHYVAGFQAGQQKRY